MAISPTGSFLQLNSTSATSIPVTVANAGDLCVLFIANQNSAIVPTSMAGTNSMGAFQSTAALVFSGGYVVRLFWATAGATGLSTVTTTWSGTIGANPRQWDGRMFTAGTGASTIWDVDASGTRTTAASTTVLYPSLVAAAAGELYVGGALVSATGAAGATSGFSYDVDAGFTNVFAYNANVGPGTFAPAAVDSTAGEASACAAILSVRAQRAAPFLSQYNSYH